MKGEIDNNLLIVDIPLSSMDCPKKKKMNKEILDLNQTLDQKELINMHEPLTEQQKNTFFSSTHANILQATSQVTKKVLANVRRLKSCQISFLNLSDVKLKIINRRRAGKYTDM